MLPDHFVVLATEDGIYRSPLLPGGEVGAVKHTLQGLTCEAVCQDAAGHLYAGSDEGRIYRSRDGGQTWHEVFHGFSRSRGLWSLVAHPVRPSELYAGLEAVALWTSRDGGEHWAELTALRDHPTAQRWHFFDPMKPHVRAIAFDERGERLYIGIEEGGVLVSQDAGQSFEDRSDGVDEDVHDIQVVPDSPDHLFAMTGGGLFLSRDGGRRWERLANGLDRWYMIPLIVVSSNLRVLCVGAGNTPPPAWRTQGADAAIYRSVDGGKTWRVAAGPFPLRGMLSAIAAVPEHPEHLLASTTDGVLLRSLDGGRRWTIAVERLPRTDEMVIICR